MSRFILGFVTSMAVFAWPVTSLGDPVTGTPDHGSWFTWEQATGDWGGARTRLENAGVTPSLNFSADLQTNPIGGQEQGSAIATDTYGSLKFDLEKLLGLQGSSFFIAGSVAAGEDLSEDDIGNFFGVSQVFSGNETRLSQVFLQQTLGQGLFDIIIGRVTPGNDFASVESFWNYVSNGINGHPGGIKANFPSFGSSPSAQWGARATITPSDLYFVSVGAYNADPSVFDEGENGLDFKFNPEDGVLYLAELGITSNQGATATGLPGKYILGALYDSSDFKSLTDDTQITSGNIGFYAIAEQMVYREGGAESDQGLTIWATITGSPDHEINRMPLFLAAGAGYKGLFHRRPYDVSSIGVFYGSFSDDLLEQDYETVLEANHRFQIAPSTYVTPDLQYVINPNGGGISDAWVVGVEVSVDF